MTKKGKRVIVHDNNVEKALRKLKKKVTECGLIQEFKDRQQFIKPTVKRKIAKSQAVRRWKKQVKDQQLPPKMF